MDGKEEVKIIKFSEIVLHPNFEIRRKNPEHIKELANSIKEVGLIHLSTVRPKDKKFELVQGFTRFYALQSLGHKEFKFTVRDLTDKEAMSITLTENDRRRSLNAIEEAQGFKNAIEIIGMKAVEVAKLVNRSESYISNRIKLLTLPASVKDMIQDDKVKPGHAEHGLFKLSAHPKMQEELAKEISKGHMDIQDSERQAKRMIEQEKERVEFQKILQAAKIKDCPKCHKRANGTDYRSSAKNVVLKCPEYHSWSAATGKDPEAYEKSINIKRAQEAKAKYEVPRSNYLKIKIDDVLKIAKKAALEALREAKITGEGVNIHLTISGPTWSSGKEIAIRNGAVDLKGVWASKDFKHFAFTDMNGEFTKAFIDYGEPKKKDLDFMREFLGFPETCNNRGKLPSEITKKTAKTKKDIIVPCFKCNTPMQELELPGLVDFAKIEKVYFCPKDNKIWESKKDGKFIALPEHLEKDLRSVYQEDLEMFRLLISKDEAKK